MLSTTGLSSRKWIQKCVLSMVMLILVVLVLILYSDTRMMNQTVGKTLTKIKEFAGVNSSVSPYMLEFSTLDPLADFSTDLDDDIKDASPVEMALDKVTMIIKDRFDERTALKAKMCSSPSYKSLIDGEKELHGRFGSLGKNRIRICRIPKVGTTYLKGLEKRVIRGIASQVGGKKSPTKKLLMVREPYSRLVSGYLGKIVTNPPWQRSIGASIVRRFRPLGSDNARRCGHDVTFPEFLKYFIQAETTGWKRNIHFVPIYKQCNPCTQNYDYIGHLETIKDDLSFALKSVNISIDMDFSDEESTMRGKATAIVRHRDRVLKCESMCSALSKVWFSFQARGLVSTEVTFPLKETECKTISEKDFSDLVWDAHLQSSGRINKSKQRRESLETLYLQAPLEDRLKVQELMMKDFELYGYDPQPDDLFPELKKST